MLSVLPAVVALSPYRKESIEVITDRAAAPDPTAADLVAIEWEWPLIAAELDLLDAEIAVLCAEDHGGPSPLDWRRLRRAESRVTRAAADLTAHPRTDLPHAA